MTPEQIKAKAEQMKAGSKASAGGKKPKQANKANKPAKPAKPADPTKQSAPKKPKPSKDEKPLTEAEETACQQFILNGGDQSKAFRFAFPHSVKWKDTSVHSRASQLFNRAKVEQRVKQLQEIAAKVAEDKFKVDAEYVLRRHHEIDTMDAADILDDDGDVLPVRQWPKVWRQSISGIEISELKAGKDDQETLVSVLKKIKWPDKIRNLELLGKHVSVNAYRDQVGVGDPSGNPFAINSIALVAPGDDRRQG